MSEPAPNHIDFAAVPAELRDRPSWVGWRTEQRGGRATKVPLDVKGKKSQRLRHAEVDDPRTWSTFEAALSAVQSGRAEGVGFVTTEDDGLSGVDLDGARDPQSGAVAPWAQEIIAELNTYAEISPSGAGVHLWLRGKGPAGSRCKTTPRGVTGLGGKAAAIEVYSRDRYLTVTSIHLEGTPLTVEDRQEELAALHRRLFGEASSSHATAMVPSTVTLDFTEPPSEMERMLAGRLLREHATILQTWASDESKGDHAFVCEVFRYLLALGEHDDEGSLLRMADRIFRASPLYAREDRQDKWTRKATNYAILTLSGALQRVREEQATSEKGGAPAERDRAHAEELARLFAGQLLYVRQRREWLKWTGAVWERIFDGDLLYRATELLPSVYIRRLPAASGEERKRLAKRAVEASTVAQLTGPFKILSGWPGIAVNLDELDRDPWRFNIQNGTLDLRTLTLDLHDPIDRMTKLAPVAYDPQAGGERWERFLDRILPNPEVRRYVQRQLGKAMVGAVLEERLDIWHGSGANGKTTLARMMMSLFGTYALQAAPNLLVAGPYDRHPAEVADLVGSRLVFSVEVDRGKHLAEAVVKHLTGGDRKKARFMREDFFQFEQTFDITLIVNHRPVISGSDIGIWRRIRLTPFMETIPEDERRPQDELVEELLSDAPAILNWLLEGLRDFQRNRTWIPQAVLAATAAYRGEQDRLGKFLEDCCEISPAQSVGAAVLYDAYEQWAHRAGEEAMRKTAFGRALSERGFASERRGHGGGLRVWRGLRLRPSVTDPAAAEVVFDDETAS